ncbi:MAG: hypothetical protein M1419_04380 [Bacteroidetes bacterium]|nr:hypothetical protein [Bacteroidota bacterium]
MKLYFINSLFVICLFCFNIARADQRSYVWTYEYQIMDIGKAEFEQYTTFSSPDIDSFKTMGSTELNFELEVGMNDRFDFAVYQVFKQSAEASLKYSGFKLRGRYKFFKKDEFFVNPLIYVEYIGNQSFSKHEFEAKLILGKDLGDFNISLNPYFEYAYEDNGWEFTPKYAVGACYHASPLFSLGVEAAGDKSGNYFGPTISHGGPGLWFSLGSLFKLGEVDAGKPEFRVRMIIGVEL